MWHALHGFPLASLGVAWAVGIANASMIDARKATVVIPEILFIIVELSSFTWRIGVLRYCGSGIRAGTVDQPCGSLRQGQRRSHPATMHGSGRRKKRYRRLSDTVRSCSLPSSANASAPSQAPPGGAARGPGYADAIDASDHARAASFTNHDDHAIRLLERHRGHGLH